LSWRRVIVAMMITSRSQQPLFWSQSDFFAFCKIIWLFKNSNNTSYTTTTTTTPAATAAAISLRWRFRLLLLPGQWWHLPNRRYQNVVAKNKDIVYGSSNNNTD
jgi:hypothetical protein